MSLLTASEPHVLAPPQERDTVVRLQEVAVRYQVPQEPIRSLKEYVIRRTKQQIRHREFWALRDINIEVKRGEALGIIGRNGAGKSTLLKVISRVMRPTRGSVWVHGRIAPLLELGAGFHPELTGRENVFLNGTLLGHSHHEIAKCFDAIVDFAGIWEFIDAPLRTYSTGMATRLGFSVATAWQPDILILDEVLSVGDEEFQLKSAERIQELRANGATILFVSHSIELVTSMCQRAIWLDQGAIAAVGAADLVARQYRGDALAVEAKRLAEASHGEAPAERGGAPAIKIAHPRILNANGAAKNIFRTGDRMVLEMDYIAHRPIPAPIFGVAIHRHDGTHITGPNTSFAGLALPTAHGNGTVRYTIPTLPLLEGLYHISIAIVNHDDTEMFDYQDRVLSFRVINKGGNVKERYGLMTLNGEWEYVVLKN